MKKTAISLFLLAVSTGIVLSFAAGKIVAATPYGTLYGQVTIKNWQDYSSRMLRICPANHSRVIKQTNGGNQFSLFCESGYLTTYTLPKDGKFSVSLTQQSYYVDMPLNSNERAMCLPGYNKIKAGQKTLFNIPVDL